MSYDSRYEQIQDYKCPICGKDMKFIPAGISKKTNKPYGAFYACTDYGCKGSRKETGEPKMPYANKPYTPQEAKEVVIEKNIAHKDAGIKFAAARRDAVAVTTALMGQGGAWNEEMVKKEIDKWINYFETVIYIDKPF